jgi:hypothetical protein
MLKGTQPIGFANPVDYASMIELGIVPTVKPTATRSKLSIFGFQDLQLWLNPRLAGSLLSINFVWLAIHDSLPNTDVTMSVRNPACHSYSLSRHSSSLYGAGHQKSQANNAVVQLLPQPRNFAIYAAHRTSQ